MYNHVDQWTVRLAEGDPSAYKRLFDTYYAPLCGFAFRYLENNSFSEDVVQDVFYEIWAKKYKFENHTYLKTFLYRAVRNRSLDLLRKRKKQINPNQIAALEEDDFFLDRILEKEVSILLRQAFGLLPDITRKIFELSLLGYDNNEIAAELNITVESVKARKQRGKHTLGEKLKNNLLYFF